MLSRIEELQLIARCALADNRQAFGQLVEAYQPDVRRLLVNLTGDVCLADDLAQDTFLKAYLSIRSFRGLSRVRTWLFRIACNEFYEWERKQRETPADNIPDRGGGSPTSTADIDIEAALGCLSAAERVVVTLFFIEDRPIREVAKIAGMPEGTVKSHIARAKVKLQKFLK